MTMILDPKAAATDRLRAAGRRKPETRMPIARAVVVGAAVGISGWPGDAPATNDGVARGDDDVARGDDDATPGAVV
jgi:hypothetical protein